MSEQEGVHSSTKQRRSHKTNTANQQNGKQAPALQHPANDDPETWKAYWKAQGQPWRSEPEIDTVRQAFLTERRSITPDIKQGVYPFKDIKLSRADVEWLLATHENGRGPVLWEEEKDKSEYMRRTGLDLRGAVVEDATDLSALPLTRLRGGLFPGEWDASTEEQRVHALLCLKGVKLSYAHLERAILEDALLESAQLKSAHLEGADLGYAHLEGAGLEGAHLEGASLRGASLASVDLAKATLANATGVGPSLVDIKWGDTHLSVVDWSQVKILGDEHTARENKDREGKTKDKLTRLAEYKVAVRANRQLAVVLRDQGLNEEADHFAYHAQVLQRVVLRGQKQYGRLLFSVFLAALTGYGYRLWRILIAYGFIVSFCALAYYVFGLFYPPHLPLLQAFLESIAAFHGRVFSELFTSNTPQVWVTAFEAIAGLVIEGVFIAMLTQRFFGK
jgi:Pentapeptide repeats (8 copies)